MSTLPMATGDIRKKYKEGTSIQILAELNATNTSIIEAIVQDLISPPEPKLGPLPEKKPAADEKPKHEPKAKKPVVKMDKVKAAEMYDKGKGDREIAEALGVSVVTVWSWRKKNELASNCGPAEAGRLGGKASANNRKPATENKEFAEAVQPMFDEVKQRKEELCRTEQMKVDENIEAAAQEMDVRAEEIMRRVQPTQPTPEEIEAFYKDSAEPVKVIPIAHHYEAEGDPPYIKYKCPNGCRYAIHPWDKKCHGCHTVLDWSAVNTEVGEPKGNRTPPVCAPETTDECELEFDVTLPPETEAHIQEVLSTIPKPGEEQSKFITHILKCQQPYFDAVWNRHKTFEVRKNDRGYKTGDHIVLKEYNAIDDTYGDRQIRADIGFLLSGERFPFLNKEYVVFTLLGTKRYELVEVQP